MITISYKKKVLEERLRRGIATELKKEETNFRKKPGLILSGIGIAIYLILGSSISISAVLLPILLVSIGAISLMGLLIGVKDIRMGGVVILISIPFSIIYILFMNIIITNSPAIINLIVLFALIPFPYPHSLFLIIGGILCLMSSN